MRISHANPYPFYEEVRRQGVRRQLDGSWWVTDYAQVYELLKSAALSKRLDECPGNPLASALLFQDAPDHDRVRACIQKAYAGIRSLFPAQRLRAMAQALMAPLVKRGQMDWIEDFALPFPVQVIAEMLGVPAADQALCAGLSQEFILASALPGPEGALRSEQAMGSLAEFFSALLEKRRVDPQEDFSSALLAFQSEKLLSPQEVVGNVVLLLLAGHETTTNLLGTGLFTLLRHPDQRALLQASPDLLESAIEEMLRYESPIQQGTHRVTLSPIRLDDVEIPAGERISAMIGAANPDPKIFVNPQQFDIRRRSNKHLSFGLGGHVCLGAALARMEARAAFLCLFELLPQVRLPERPGGWIPDWIWRTVPLLQTFFPAPSPDWRNHTIVRGLSRLPLEWERSCGAR